MTRLNIFFLYLGLSAINGFVPTAIALSLSVPGMIALSVWGLVTLVSFALICTICMGSAMRGAASEPEKNNLNREFNEAAIYN